jgi:hypothetical protein
MSELRMYDPMCMRDAVDMGDAGQCSVAVVTGLQRSP